MPAIHVFNIGTYHLQSIKDLSAESLSDRYKKLQLGL